MHYALLSYRVHRKAKCFTICCFPDAGGIHCFGSCPELQDCWPNHHCAITITQRPSQRLGARFTGIWSQLSSLISTALHGARSAQSSFTTHYFTARYHRFPALRGGAWLADSNSPHSQSNPPLRHYTECEVPPLFLLPLLTTSQAADW